MSLHTYRVTYTIDGTEIIVFEFSSTTSLMENAIEEAMNTISIDQLNNTQIVDVIGFSILRLPSLQ